MAKVKTLFTIILISLIPTLFIWFPFFLRLGTFWTIPTSNEGMATIVANYDGPLYIAVAKSFYAPDILERFTFDLPNEYFAAHFPLFPLLIRLFSILGYPYAMLLVTILSSIFAIYIFSKYISEFVDKKQVLWMTILFSIFPARWLIVRSIGSPEPLFIGLIIASIYFFRKQKYLFSAIFGGLAAITKSPGIILFPALLCAYLFPLLKDTTIVKRGNSIPLSKIIKIFPIILIPIATLSVFYLFKIKLNDFLAYFHSGDNIHLFFPPFSIFNPSLTWVGTFWLEEVIFVYLLGAIGIINLFKKDPVSSWFCLIFFATTLFISHRDIIRYSLPIVPFLLVGYSDYLTKKEFKYAFYLVIIPIYLFSLAFISKNVMPIPDWGPLL